MYQLTIKDTHCRRSERAGAGRVRSGFRLKLTRLRVLILVVLTVILTLSLSSSGGKPVEYLKIEVNRGDTLWSIASRHAGSGADPRILISKIKDINQLENVILQPGQVLKVPAV